MSCTTTPSGRTASSSESADSEQPAAPSEAARQRWTAASIDAYALEIEELENHWLRGCRWMTTIVDGMVVYSSWSTATSDGQVCTDEDWTVEMLFELIEDQALDIERFSEPEFGEHVHLVSYDERGVPTRVEFDLANGDDEERLLVISFTATETR